MTEELGESTRESRYVDRNGRVVYVTPSDRPGQCYTVSCKRISAYDISKGIGYPRSRQLKCAECFRKYVIVEQLRLIVPLS